MRTGTLNPPHPASAILRKDGRRSRKRWCATRESNPHIFRYKNLNLACLPVPPVAHSDV